MDLGNINKKYMVGFVAVALIILIVITVVQPGNITYVDNTDYEQLQAKAEFEKAEYAKVLEEVAPDYQASKEILEKVASEEVFRAETESLMNTKRTVVYPEVRDIDIKIANRKDQDAVANYITTTSSMVVNMDNEINPLMSQLFSGSPAAAVEAREKSQAVLENLKQITVPIDAVAMHKSLLVAQQKYSEIFGLAEKYSLDSQNTPWSNLYDQFVILDTSMRYMKAEVTKLDQIYALGDIQLPASSNPFIKTAQAGWPVIDIAVVVKTIYQTALSLAFANFFTKISDNVINRIQKTFTIASQLFYANVLDRHYSLEYMQKFVPDDTDKLIIQQFLPKSFCEVKDEQKLNQIFEAKAREARGDYLILDPSDPRFLASNGSLASVQGKDGNWWDGFYQAYAGQVDADSKKASISEVLSPGIKAAKSSIDGYISITMEKIKNAQQNFMKSVLDLGATNTDDPVTVFVAGITTMFINNNVFTPAGLADAFVYKEQKVCNRIPVMNIVAPIAKPEYAAPSKGADPIIDPLPSGGFR